MFIQIEKKIINILKENESRIKLTFSKKKKHIKNQIKLSYQMGKNSSSPPKGSS